MKIMIKILLLMAISFSISACKYFKKQTTGVYIYSFEKVAPISTDDSKKMISDFLNITNVHDLTVSKDENIAYFVADEDLNTTFEQNLSNGNFAFSKLTTAYLNMVPDLPSEGEAVRIAEKYLDSKDITPKIPAEMRLVHSGGMRSQALVNGEQGGPIVDLLVTLTYGRVIDSLPVIGAGSKIIISIGDKGEVYGVTRNWRELNASGKKEVIPKEMITDKEAEEMARKQIMEEFGKETRFEIKGIQKSYYDGNGNILQPVWAFDTRLYLTGLGGNREPASYLCIIPMLKNSPEPIKLNVIDSRSKDLIKEIKDRSGIPPANPDEIKEKD